MNILELILESLNSLTINKMRTSLAVLGIIIGIGSVIALISLGQGGQKAIENQIQSLGSNLLTVIPGSFSSSGVRGSAGSSNTLTLQDAQAIKADLSSLISDVSPELSNRSQVTAGRNNTNTQVFGVQSAYADVKKLTMQSGSFITTQEDVSLAKVVVLGPTVAESLFPNTDPLGQNIRINNQTLRVIGVTQPKGGSGFNNPDDAIYIPLTTAQKQIFGKDYLSTISISVISEDQMVQAQDQVGYLLLKRHKLNSPQDADFTIMSQSDILSTASQATSIFTSLLGGIAAISLLVGGIGIMNIMLVTVTERTREIGLRKALGAKRKTVIAQFLIESIILTLAGGLIGLILGVSISYFLSTSLGFPFAISLNSLLLSVGVSAAIGIIFGWYPARKAARLQPIEALRYE